VFVCVTVDRRTDTGTFYCRNPIYSEISHNFSDLAIAVGGWGRSNGFEGMLADDASKKRFIFSLKKLCLKYDIGGIDLTGKSPSRRQQF
jgi:GH18 family chitinase